MREKPESLNLSKPGLVSCLSAGSPALLLCQWGMFVVHTSIVLLPKGLRGNHSNSQAPPLGKCASERRELQKWGAEKGAGGSQPSLQGVEVQVVLVASAFCSRE